MSILSGPEIKRQVGLERIIISPFDQRQLNPVSYDVRLGDRVAIVTKNRIAGANWKYLFDGGALLLHEPGVERGVHCLDSKQQSTLLVAPRLKSGAFLLEPGQLYLGHTEERIRTDHYVPTIDGKSSIGRLGVFIHVTAGYGEPGFDGQWTLEIVVTVPTILYPGMRIGQVRFTTIEGEVEQYRGNYRGDYSKGPVASRAWRQFEQDAAEEKLYHDALPLDDYAAKLHEIDPLAAHLANQFCPDCGGSITVVLHERCGDTPQYADDSVLESMEHAPHAEAVRRAGESVFQPWKPRNALKPLCLKKPDQSWTEWLKERIAHGNMPPEALAEFQRRASTDFGPDEPTEGELHELVTLLVDNYFCEYDPSGERQHNRAHSPDRKRIVCVNCNRDFGEAPHIFHRGD